MCFFFGMAHVIEGQFYWERTFPNSSRVVISSNKRDEKLSYCDVERKVKCPLGCHRVFLQKYAQVGLRVPCCSDAGSSSLVLDGKLVSKSELCDEYLLTKFQSVCDLIQRQPISFWSKAKPTDTLRITMRPKYAIDFLQKKEALEHVPPFQEPHWVSEWFLATFTYSLWMCQDGHIWIDVCILHNDVLRVSGNRETIEQFAEWGSELALNLVDKTLIDMVDMSAIKMDIHKKQE